jgi:hypothetical protein
MNPDQLRLVLAKALDGAAERLRAGIHATPSRADASMWNPLPRVVEHVLKVEDVAHLLVCCPVENPRNVGELGISVSTGAFSPM